MRFGGTDVWKVGYAADVDARLAEINTHIPVEIIGFQWNHFARHPWRSPSLAFEMEQRLLAEIQGKRIARERVMCSEVELLCAWRRVNGLAV